MATSTKWWNMSKAGVKQLKLNFRGKSDYLAGFRAGFKDRVPRSNMSAEYMRGYRNGRVRRNVDL